MDKNLGTSVISNELDSTPYQASRIRAAYILIFSWLVTFKHSLRAIWAALVKKKTREEVDQVIREWAQALVDLVQINVRVVGEFPTHNGRPTIVMCNHSSTYDIPVSFVSLPGSIRMLAKKELFRIPILGQCMKVTEFISINRQDKEQARQDLQFAKAKMSDGIVLWIAPEGTRSRTGDMLPLKKGGMHLAIQTQAQIVPVAIKNIQSIMPVGTFKFLLNETVEVRIGEPIDASEFNINSRNELTEQVSQSIAQLLEPPLTLRHR